MERRGVRDRSAADPTHARRRSLRYDLCYNSRRGRGRGAEEGVSGAEDAVSAVVREVTRLVSPVLRRVAEISSSSPEAGSLACCGEPQLVGCVSSLPRAPHQHWHADGLQVSTPQPIEPPPPPHPTLPLLPAKTTLITPYVPPSTPL